MENRFDAEAFKPLLAPSRVPHESRTAQHRHRAYWRHLLLVKIVRYKVRNGKRSR